MSAPARMMTFHIPADPRVLTAVGEVAIRHGQLDHILRMTIKTLAGLTPQQALDATASHGSALLRERIGKLANQRLGEGSALLQIQAILERCRRATQRRDDLVHGLWARELDGDPAMRTSDHAWKPIPTVEELNALTSELVSLTDELNNARLEGFLAAALAARGKKA